MKTRSSIKPVPIDFDSSNDSDQPIMEEVLTMEIKMNDSVVFTEIKEKRKTLMPEKEIAALMYAFGDSPEQDSVQLMDELLQDYLMD